MDQESTVAEVLQAWPENQGELAKAFQELIRAAEAMAATECRIVTRPGVSHSFRAALTDSEGKRARPVYFLVDVVVSKADPWFLSVCFYEDEISDPEELGNPIPQGLFQETGYCFDVDDLDPDLLAYLKARLVQAHQAALKTLA